MSAVGTVALDFIVSFLGIVAQMTVTVFILVLIQTGDARKR